MAALLLSELCSAGCSGLLYNCFPIQVTLSGDRILPLAAFRGTTRPVIVAGSKGQVSRALAAAEPYK